MRTGMRQGMQALIDEEVRLIVDEGYETAKRILNEKREDLENLAQGLLEYETLTGSEIQRVIDGESIHRDDDGADLPPGDDGSKITAVPKTGKKPKSDPDPGMEPQPQ